MLEHLTYKMKFCQLQRALNLKIKLQFVLVKGKMLTPMQRIVKIPLQSVINRVFTLCHRCQQGNQNKLLFISARFWAFFNWCIAHLSRVFLCCWLFLEPYSLGWALYAHIHLIWRLYTIFWKLLGKKTEIESFVVCSKVIHCTSLLIV